ncbi:HAMP domain-containing sensor histidine kinase [Nitratireductor sp. ZSWI3]|uniref:sensor histidine kinase n=1 Tax=Nitratireductor sp. ZSWI3 TaxID=2966359 RepID=UPI00214F95D2|nr:HAMP domain-containing sensor histidine kinase [Nitratireductor sp. ZSWI3]MCR4265333.1 HAMP domain-containing histidine kinase [Nitratireductor sp. ZSWI3]
MHPSVTETGERLRQLRLVGVLFAAPFLVGSAAIQLLSGLLGLGGTLAVVSAGFGLFWMLAALVLTTGRRMVAEALGLVLAGTAIALLISVAGGAASPLTVLVGALAIETFFVARSRRAVLAGTLAAAAALVAGGVLAAGSSISAIASAPSAAQWIAPLLYGITLAVRVSRLWLREEASAPERSDDFIEEHMDALVLHLTRSGDVISASPQAARLLNVRSDILLGTGFFERLHVADRVTYLCALSAPSTEAHQRRVSVRLRMPLEDGGARAPGYRRFGIEFLAGRMADTVIAIVRDENDKAELEAQIVTARETARAARLESERLMAAVSHELRTPLNAILGFSDTLLTEIFGRFSDERQRDYVRLIHQAGGHLLSVVNATLEVSKVESGTYVLHPEAFSFAEAVEASLALTAAQAEERSIAIKAKIGDDVGVVFCDRRVVQQVLINLLSNAVKFTPSGGKIVIAAERAGDRIDFSVSDTGVGIAAEDLQRIGQPFMQIRNEATRHVEGTGLGLALVKGLVGLQGGGLTIDSAPGEGTRVSVSLPVTGSVKKGETSRATVPAIDEEWHDEDYRKTA